LSSTSTLTDGRALSPVDQSRTTAAPISEKEWAQKLAAYRTPRLRRSLFELVVTAVPFLVLWLGTLVGVKLGYWPSLLLVLPAAAFLMRLFAIQHDCGHGSFFRRRWANDMVGRVIGVLTLTPYDDWRRSHAKHHAGSGNLDRRGVGDIDLLTVAEYRALCFRRRLVYRLSRNAIVLLVIAPIYVFIIRQRLPNDLFRADRRAWTSTLSTNLAIAALLIGLGLPGRIRPAPPGACPDHPDRFGDRYLALLRAAPVRAHLLGARPRVVLSQGRYPRQHPLRSPGAAPLAQRQYRHSPRPPPRQPHPELPPE
jgi:hypothetical protein